MNVEVIISSTRLAATVLAALRMSALKFLPGTLFERRACLGPAGASPEEQRIFRSSVALLIERLGLSSEQATALVQRVVLPVDALRGSERSTFSIDRIELGAAWIGAAAGSQISVSYADVSGFYSEDPSVVLLPSVPQAMPDPLLRHHGLYLALEVDMVVHHDDYGPARFPLCVLFHLAFRHENAGVLLLASIVDAWAAPISAVLSGETLRSLRAGLPRVYALLRAQAAQSRQPTARHSDGMLDVDDQNSRPASPGSGSDEAGVSRDPGRQYIEIIEGIEGILAPLGHALYSIQPSISSLLASVLAPVGLTLTNVGAISVPRTDSLVIRLELEEPQYYGASTTLSPAEASTFYERKVAEWQNFYDAVRQNVEPFPPYARESLPPYELLRVAIPFEDVTSYVRQRWNTGWRDDLRRTIFEGLRTLLALPEVASDEGDTQRAERGLLSLLRTFPDAALYAMQYAPGRGNETPVPQLAETYLHLAVALARLIRIQRGMELVRLSEWQEMASLRGAFERWEYRSNEGQRLARLLGVSREDGRAAVDSNFLGMVAVAQGDALLPLGFSYLSARQSLVALDAVLPVRDFWIQQEMGRLSADRQGADAWRVTREAAAFLMDDQRQSDAFLVRFRVGRPSDIDAAQLRLDRYESQNGWIRWALDLFGAPAVGQEEMWRQHARIHEMNRRATAAMWQGTSQMGAGLRLMYGASSLSDVEIGLPTMRISASGREIFARLMGVIDLIDLCGGTPTLASNFDAEFSLGLGAMFRTAAYPDSPEQLQRDEGLDAMPRWSSGKMVINFEALATLNSLEVLQCGFAVLAALPFGSAIAALIGKWGVLAGLVLGAMFVLAGGNDHVISPAIRAQLQAELGPELSQKLRALVTGFQFERPVSFHLRPDEDSNLIPLRFAASIPNPLLPLWRSVAGRLGAEGSADSLNLMLGSRFVPALLVYSEGPMRGISLRTDRLEALVVAGEIYETIEVPTLDREGYYWHRGDNPCEPLGYELRLRVLLRNNYPVDMLLFGADVNAGPCSRMFHLEGLEPGQTRRLLRTSTHALEFRVDLPLALRSGNPAFLVLPDPIEVRLVASAGATRATFQNLTRQVDGIFAMLRDYYLRIAGVVQERGGDPMVLDPRVSEMLYGQSDVGESFRSALLDRFRALCGEVQAVSGGVQEIADTLYELPRNLMNLWQPTWDVEQVQPSTQNVSDHVSETDKVLSSIPKLAQVGGGEILMFKNSQSIDVDAVAVKYGDVASIVVDNSNVAESLFSVVKK